MPNLTSSRIEGSSEPSTVQPSPASPGSHRPLHVEPPSLPDGILPPASVDDSTKIELEQATIGAPSTPDATPHLLRERNHELINFLVRRAIDKCMPSDPHPSLSTLGARQRSAARKPWRSKSDKGEC